MPPKPPACSEQVESWLTGRGVKFAPCRRILIDQIKHKESRLNQARAEALDPDVVDRYTVAVRQGEQFPPIVVYKSGSGYVIVDGNHRDEAHVKAGAADIVAYVLDDDTPSDVIEILVVEANVRHGLPTNTAWRVSQAIHLLAAGHDMESVTTSTGVTKNQIDYARRAARADERADRLGIYGWDEIPLTSRAFLSSLGSDPVLSQVAGVVIDTKMGGDDIKAFIRQIKGATSEADALRIVGEVGDQRKSRLGGIRKGKQQRMASPRTRVLAALGAVTHLSPGDIPRLFTTEEDRKEVAKRCGDAALVLMDMEEVLRHALGS